MKRFYCTICQRIKRVRVIPFNVVNSHRETPELRTGTCAWHDRTHHSFATSTASSNQIGFGEMRPRAINTSSKKKGKK